MGLIFHHVAALTPTECRRFLTIMVGPLMATVAMLLSYLIAANVGIAALPEIENACNLSAVPLATCIEHASTAGLLSFASFALVSVVFFVAVPFAKPRSEDCYVLQFAVELLVIGCLALVLAHLIAIDQSPAFASRIAALDHFSNFISLENLIWPLLLQVLLIESRPRVRIVAISALLLIMALSPYRSVTLAIFVFAFMIPLASSLLALASCRPRSGAALFVGYRMFIIGAVGVVVLVAGTIDTAQRAVEAPPVHLVSDGNHSNQKAYELTTLGRLEQRLAYPLYQAAIVAHLAHTTTLPNIINEFERKLRLSQKPNLNEFTYRLIYPKQGANDGETTSLYYGEGAAYFGAAKLWTIGGPFFFVAAWVLMNWLRIEASVILSVGIWRSSFAGLITILPALFFQLIAIMAITYAGQILNRYPRLSLPISRILSALVMALISSLIIFQVGFMGHEFQRESLLQVSFAAADGCHFVFGPKAAVQQSVDRTVERSGLDVHSFVVQKTDKRLKLVFPYGSQLLQRLPELLVLVRQHAVCNGISVVGGATVVESHSMIYAIGSTALTALAIVFLLGAATSYWRFWRKKEPSEFFKAI